MMRRPRDAGDVADHLVELEVHLGQRLLHALNHGGAIADEGVAVTDVAAQDADLVVGAEGGREQPEGVQLLQPLAVLDVALSRGDVLDVARVDEPHLESASLQDLEQGDPVDAGGLHRHRVDAAALEPVGELMEVGGEAAKAAHRLRITVLGYGDVVLLRADVDAGGVEVDGLETGRKPAAAGNRLPLSPSGWFGRVAHRVGPPCGWDVLWPGRPNVAIS